MRSATLVLTLLAIAPALLQAAETHTQRTYHEVRTGMGKPLSTWPDHESCAAEAVRKGVEEGKTRTSGANTYACYTVTNVIFRFSPGTTPVECPPLNDSPRTQACPAGSTGSWEQTGTVGAPPACTVTWSPATPPEGKCVTDPEQPPVLAAPSGVSAVPNATAGHVRVAFTAAANTQATLLDFCRGATCTNFATPTCLTASPFDHRLPAGATARYRLRGSRDTSCSSTAGNLGPASPIVTATLGFPPAAPGTAQLSWTPPTRNADGSGLTDLAGYRIYYGRTAGELTRTLQIGNASVTSQTISDLAAGTWFFALRAYNAGGGESGLSNVISKVVP